MRHQKAGFKLGRNHHERQSLFRNLIRGLVINEHLLTTMAKAKAIKPLVDKLITTAKAGTLTARRRILAQVADRQTANKLFTDIALRAKKRTSGFTRIRRSVRRLGDDTQLVKMEWVDAKVEVKKVEKKK